eukprot:gnl/Chilomastix_cuspidata/1336.p1 GENE.gnl/Chilomastix_cuspidata/1336~~gnl/Chilomastix_cuspidata/1336.p1  ORF type:complete len:349 (+),score=171.36 gnl/Chilomastix_cuspidata/1336:1058-2104(+)
MPPRTFDDDSSDLPKGKELPRASFEITANSRTEQLSRLFDDSNSTTYTTSSSRPHTVTFTFYKPEHLSYLCMYRNGSDGSYTPSVIKLVCTNSGGADFFTKTFNTRKKTNWVHFPLPKKPIKKLLFSIEENHSGGRDSKVRQMKLIRSCMSAVPFNREKHAEMLMSDLRRVRDDLVLRAGGAEFAVPAFSFALHFPRLFRRRDGASLALDLPAELVQAVAHFVRNDMAATVSAAVTIPPMPPASPLHVPPQVFARVHGVATLFAFAKEQDSLTLKHFCENFIASKICSMELNADVLEWIESGSVRLLRLVNTEMVHKSGIELSQMSHFSKPHLESILESLVRQGDADA